MTTLSAHDVAAQLRERLPGLSAKKLQKLLYYCQGHHLATFGDPLFVETISAWDMGPVVGTLWWAEKHGQVAEPAPVTGEAELNTIGYVVSRYGALSGTDLQHLTHSEAPYQRADARRVPKGSAKIELSWMTEYFRTADAADEDSELPPLDSGEVEAWLERAPKRLEEPVGEDSLDELLTRLASGG